jgi:alanine racemase
MYKEALRTVWAEIDLDALRYNIRNIRAKVGEDRKIYGVIKADAYGHGAIECAKVLQEEGVHAFAIATLHEAIELRQAGIRDEILCLGLTPDVNADTIIQYDITPVVDDFSAAKALSDAATDSNDVGVPKVVRCVLASDTGMGRIGWMCDTSRAINAAVEEIKQIDNLPFLEIAGIFSHFATADAEDKTFSKQQAKRFRKLTEAIEQAGVKLPMKMIANSAAIMEIPEVWFDAVRPGIILYGQYPSDEVDRAQLDIKPVMSVKANIIKVKQVPTGYSCGYGRKFIAKRPSVIATIALGYADGYPRPYSGSAKVIVDGRYAPIAGNICMDQCMIDVTDIPNVKVWDEVIIMGSSPAAEDSPQKGQTLSVTADYIAAATGTINYEITCAFGQRLPKVYLNK